jgi:hypothetical protein
MANPDFRLYRLLSDILMYTCTDTHIDTRCHISTKQNHAVRVLVDLSAFVGPRRTFWPGDIEV